MCAKETATVTMYRWDEAKGDGPACPAARVSALDPTIFRHSGRWWLLFCTSAAAEGANERLVAWHAKETWLAHKEPHMANPLKVDIRSARDLRAVRSFMRSTDRPARDCSTHYGAATYSIAF